MQKLLKIRKINKMEMYKSHSSILLEFLTWKMIQNEFEGYVVTMMFLSFNQSPADFAERVWASYGEYILSIWFIIDFGMSSLLCQKPKRMWVVIFERLITMPFSFCIPGYYLGKRQKDGGIRLVQKVKPKRGINSFQRKDRTISIGVKEFSGYV